MWLWVKLESFSFGSERFSQTSTANSVRPQRYRSTIKGQFSRARKAFAKRNTSPIDKTLSKFVEDGLAFVQYCPTSAKRADIFTEPLDRVKFEAQRDVLGVVGISVDKQNKKGV